MAQYQEISKYTKLKKKQSNLQKDKKLINDKIFILIIIIIINQQAFKIVET